MIDYEKVNKYKNYCLSCINPLCKNGCPLGNDICGFIKHMKNDDYESAYKLLCKTTVLSSVCGRICPHNKQCQGMCIRNKMGNSVNIGYLESVVGDLAIYNNWTIPKSNKKINKNVLVIGSGPAGLTCASFLARNGINVTIYEKHNYLGGILNHGVPEFRLNRNILKDTIDKILDLGINVKYNMQLGIDYTINDVINNYDAIFIGIGANISNKMNIKGENLNGVYGGNELLENNNHPDYINKTVVVIGGGNVAMDVSRYINSKGAKKVYVVYRRSEDKMPAEKNEVIEAKSENIEFLFNTRVLQINGNDSVNSILCIKTNTDNDKYIDIENSEYILNTDYVVMTVGSHSDLNIVNNLNLELNENGTIKIDENGKTSNDKIYAGGDIAGIKSTVAFAAASGRNSAYAIINYLGGSYE